MFFIAFLVYPGCSAKIFQTFQCYQFDGKIEPGDFTFDDGAEYGAGADIMLRNTTWLRADLSINCADPWHVTMTLYAVGMLFVYPIGIPAAFAYLLFWRHRHTLKELKRRQLRAGAHATIRGRKALIARYCFP